MPLAETGARGTDYECITVQYAVSMQERAAAAVPAEDKIRTWCRHLLQRLHVDGEVTLRIVTESEMQGLNAQYRGQDKVTNVLSFPFTAPEEERAEYSIEIPVRLLGDIVLCATVISREAVAQNKRCDAHWAHMVVHGVLHLLNYDHQEVEAADEMERLETEMLRELGFPPPYETG